MEKMSCPLDNLRTYIKIIKLNFNKIRFIKDNILLQFFKLFTLITEKY